MTTRTTEVRLGAVKLIDGGLKGIVVKYEQTEVRNNREFFTEFPGVKKKYPIHHELEECFGWLKGYLLNLCNYSDKSEDRETLIAATDITGVTYNDKGFVISGKMATLNNKTFALNTPLMTPEDGYPDYSKVTSILDAIYTETKEYMGGSKVMSDQAYVMKVNKNNSDFDINTFMNLPEAEQMKIASDIMAKNKCMVVPMGDIEIDMDEEEMVEQEPTLDNWVGAADQNEQPIQEPAEKEAKVVQFTPKASIVETEDDFIINIPEPVLKKSTAKKIAK